MAASFPPNSSRHRFILMEAARMTLGEIHTALADTKAKARKRYYRVKKS